MIFLVYRVWNAIHKGEQAQRATDLLFTWRLPWTINTKPQISATVSH